MGHSERWLEKPLGGSYVGTLVRLCDRSRSFEFETMAETLETMYEKRKPKKVESLKRRRA